MQSELTVNIIKRSLVPVQEIRETGALNVTTDTGIGMSHHWIQAPALRRIIIIGDINMIVPHESNKEPNVTNAVNTMNIVISGTITETIALPVRTQIAVKPS
jgi:hypothetical protein